MVNLIKGNIGNYLNDIVAESADVVIFTPVLEKNTLHKYEGKL